MSVIYIVIPIGVVVVLAALLGFRWAMRGGQFDDLEGSSLRMLIDDEELATEKTSLEGEKHGTHRTHPHEQQQKTSHHGV